MRTRRTAKSGLTLIEVGILLLIIVMSGVMWARYADHLQAEPMMIRCRNNLNQLAKGMATYLDEYGDGRWFPYPTGRGLDPYDFSGAEWLASLYWTRVVRAPGVFICPASSDSNDNGLDLGKDRAIPGRFGPGTVSYAGMHYSSLGDGVAIPADYPPNKPMASDDTQGDIHHGTLTNGGMSVLFFDSHVEFKTHEELDLEHAVGQVGGLLEELAN